MEYKTILMYLPVIHAGYEEFIDRHRSADQILLLGEDFDEIFPVLTKEIRALDGRRAAAYISHLYHRPQVRVISPNELASALKDTSHLVMPDEDIMRELKELYFENSTFKIEFDQSFLRWDRNWSKTGKVISTNVRTTSDKVSKILMTGALDTAELSSDWWRQVGAICMTESGEALSAYNHHLPSEYSPYINGDPRNNFSRGVEIELSTAIHAEASVIAEAARNGIALKGAEIYVTTFPCPSCARIIAEAGIKKVYFAGPYSLLDGEDILISSGVSLVWVDMENPPSD